MAESKTNKKGLLRRKSAKKSSDKNVEKSKKKAIAFIGKETNRRFVIDSKKPLPEFDSPFAKAYELENIDASNSVDNNYFALISDPDNFPRINMMKEQVQAESKGFMTPVDWGIVLLAEKNKEMIAIVFEKPFGKKLFGELSDQIQPVSIEQVKKFLETLLPEIRFFQDLGLSHRGIRPTNIFHNKDGFIIGEAVSAYPSAGQSSIFEPVESAMCFPNAGRGKGDIVDDFYSLGVTIIFMLLGRSPIDIGKERGIKAAESNLQKIEDDFLFERLNLGSYRALTQGLNLDPAMTVLLGGLLQDNYENRWDISAIEEWCFGRYTNPNRVFSSNMGEQTISFSGRKHFKTRSLVAAFCKRPQEAIAKLYSGEIYTNLEKIINAENSSFTVDHIDSLVKSSGSPQAGGVDTAISRISILIDPKAPIRYKGVSFFPDGLAYIIPLLKKNKKTSVIKGVEHFNLLVNWTNSNSSRKNVDITKNIEKLVNNNSFGYGLEKCTYLLNPNLPCQSRLFKGLFINDFSRILSVIEDATRNNKDIDLIDQELAAFLMVHLKVPDGWTDEVNSKDPNSKNFINMLRLLSLVQENMEKSTPVPHVSTWFCTRLKKHIETFKSNSRKEKALKKTEQIVEKGSLKAMLDLILDPEELGKEEKELRTAKHKYNLLEKDIDSYRAFRSYIFSPSYTFGWTLANIISVIILLITLLYFT